MNNNNNNNNIMSPVKVPNSVLTTLPDNLATCSTNSPNICQERPCESKNQVGPTIAGTQVSDVQEGPCVSVTQVSQEFPGTLSEAGPCVSVNQVSQIVPGTRSEKGSCVLVTKLGHKLPGTQSEKGSWVSVTQVCQGVPGTQSEKGSCVRNTRLLDQNSISNFLQNSTYAISRTHGSPSLSTRRPKFRYPSLSHERSNLRPSPKYRLSYERPNLSPSPTCRLCERRSYKRSPSTTTNPNLSPSPNDGFPKLTAFSSQIYPNFRLSYERPSNFLPNERSPSPPY